MAAASAVSSPASNRAAYRSARAEPYRITWDHARVTERVLAVGINCTRPDLVEALIGEARGGTGKPVVVYPNSGETWDAAARSWRGRGDLVAEEARFGAMAREWYAAGAQAVGGCCRTGPGHIRAGAQSRVGSPD